MKIHKLIIYEETMSHMKSVNIVMYVTKIFINSNFQNLDQNQ